jgi:hypothetical protein
MVVVHSAVSTPAKRRDTRRTSCCTWRGCWRRTAKASLQATSSSWER